jgi:hypothetical protein
MRCINATRACGGYEDLGFPGFRIYASHNINQESILTTARKCTMPKRVQLPGTNFLPEDVLPIETSQEESNALSLRAFLYDYCVISPNPKLSRGFLSRLEALAYRQGLNSDLVKACQAVSFATPGKPLNRPQLVYKAAMFNQELLGSLARAIQDPIVANSIESRLIAMLLGLYQVIT